MNPRIVALCFLGIMCSVVAQALPPGSRAPSVELGEFGAAFLDKILAPLDHEMALPRNELAQLRGSFIDRRSRAPENEKPVYHAAIGVCNAVAQAMDERERAITSFHSSSSVPSAADLYSHRKDRPTWKDFFRERDEARKGKEVAAQKNNFLNSQLTTSWQQRAIQLRQNVDRLYGRVMELERQAQQQAPSARETITLDSPLQVKVKYGTVTLPAGTTLPVVSRDAKGIVVQYSGEQITLPP